MKIFFNEKSNVYDLKKLLPILSVFLGVFLLIITLLPLLMLCMYNHPSTLDDFVSFNSTKIDYDFTSIWRIGSRYSTPPTSLPWHFSIHPTIQEIQHMLIIYRLYSVFFILFFSFSVFFVLKQCNTYFLKMNYATFFLFYSGVLFFLINSIGHFAYFFYDIILTSGYTYGICLMLLFLGFLIKYHFAKNKLFLSFILLFLTFIINGTMEYYPVLLGFILFVYFISLWVKKSEKHFFIIILFLLCFFTALTYVFSSSVGGKVAAYSPGISKPYTIQRFSVWFSDTCFYFVRNFFDYFSFKRLPFIILLSFITAIKLNKRGFKIYGRYLGLAYFIVLVMSFSLFVAGVIYVSVKISSIVIFNLILAINMFFIYMYVFQKIIVLYSNLIKKYDLDENIKKIQHACADEFSVYRKKFYILTPIIIVFYITFVGVYKPGLPTRQAWKDLLKGTAYSYNAEVLSIYEKVLYFPEKDVTVAAIENIPETLVVDNFWSIEKYKIFPQDINMYLAPFFNKKSIRIISK